MVAPALRRLGAPFTAWSFRLSPRPRGLTLDAGVESQSARRASSIETLQTNLLPELQSSTTDPASTRTLVRPSTLQLQRTLIDPLLQPSSTNPAPTLALIDGPRGVGKSTLLAQTVATARSSGIIVLFIRDARQWVHGAGFFCPTYVPDVDPIAQGLSAVRFFDRPVQVHSALSNLLKNHEDALRQLPTLPQFSTELTKNCQTLHDVVAHGVALIEDIDSNYVENPARAADALHQTIAQLCASPDAPFALVIDDYHTLVGLTCMQNDRRRRLHSNAIRTLSSYLGRPAIERTAETMSSGFILLAAEEKPPPQPWRRTRVVSSAETPLSDEVLNDPGGTRWLEGLRDRLASPDNPAGLHLRVPDCQPGELKAMCATFAPRGLGRDATNPDSRAASDRLVMLAGGRGAVMRSIFDSR